MRDLIYVSTLFLSPIFFAIIAIMGIQYSGSSESNLYIIIALLYFFISVLTLFFNHTIKKKYSVSVLISILIIIGITINGLVFGKTNSSMFRQFIIFCIPASLIGIHYARRGSIESLIKWLDWLMLLLSISFIFSTNNLLLRIADQTSHYSQNLSYNATLALLLNLFLLSFGNRYKRFSIFKNKFYKYLCYILIPLQLSVLFIGGGRGALVTLFIGLIVYFFQFKKPTHKFFKFLIYSFLIVISLSYLLTNFLEIDVVNILVRNADRAINFLDTGLSSYDRTSGRDALYRQSIELIFSRPLSGYGLFNYVSYIKPHPYPHNLLLEWALQGGLFFMLISIFIIVVLIFNMFKRNKYHPINTMFFLLVVYAFCPLLFSGSYLQSPFFWFVIMYMINYCIPKEQNRQVFP